MATSSVPVMEPSCVRLFSSTQSVLDRRKTPENTSRYSDRTDGYTLLLVATPAAINAALYDNLNFNLIRDVAPVAGIMRSPNVMAVNPSLPATTVPEFIAYAKANPGKVNMATGGVGTTLHIFGELFKMMAGVELVPVVYHGGAPALLDLIAGQMQVIFDPLPEAIGYIKAGTISKSSNLRCDYSLQLYLF